MSRESYADAREETAVALTIAGTDPTGAAGINADLQAFRDCGVHGAAAITAVLWQNTQGVNGWRAVEPDELRGQLMAVADDLKLAAVKIGMVPTAELVDVVANFIGELDESVSVVFDPVMASGGGDRELTTASARERFEVLAGRVDLITPNVPEACQLVGDVDEEEPEELARRLMEAGWRRVMLKGGHLGGGNGRIVDWYAQDGYVEPLPALQRVDADVRGTGCQLSSAIAAWCATGGGWRDAVANARLYLNDLLVTRAKSIGEGRPLVVRVGDRR